VRAASGNRIARAAFAFVITLLLSYWHARVTHRFSAPAAGTFFLLTIAALATGRWVLRAVPLHDRPSALLPIEFICGYFVVSTALFVLSLASPLGATINFAVVLATIAGIGLLMRRRRTQYDTPLRERASFVCLAIAAAAATLWASDALEVSYQDGDTTVFTLWKDTFFHATQIGQFAQAHGSSTLSDIRIAGEKPSLYHYAGYAVPATLVAITGTGAYEIFAAFHLPFGIFLSGLAAFSLAAFIWGPWPGVAAAAGLLLLPDAYQQGFGNRYLSYNFLQQVSVGSLYGVAYAAVAWVFVLNGCRGGRLASVASGWGIAVVTLVHKAHIFVANAFLIMVYPFLFLGRVGGRTRLIVGLLFVGVFVAVVWITQRFPMVPILRLDGSGAATYMHSLLANYDEGPLKDWTGAAFSAEGFPRPLRALLYAAVLIALTFGGWAIAFVTTVLLIRRKIEPVFLVLPLLVVVNYLVMSLGLAMDTRSIGTGDELLNRPLVWAYFVVVTWTSGAAYVLLFGRDAPRSHAARAALTACTLLALVLPWTLGRNLQTFPARAGHATYAEHSGVPTCLVAAARYIRVNSAPDAILQDSEGDPNFVLTSLAERREFAVRSLVESRARVGLKERLSRLGDFERLTDEHEIQRFAAHHRITWYVLHPSTRVAWPQSLIDKAVFACGGIRVYRFDVR
jgi:hypothetical protein